ncbi:MAG: VanW family protein, partial [Clostridia bacterium]
YGNYQAFQQMRSVVNRQTFYEGIVVDGQSLDGLTLEEASALLQQKGKTQAEAFSVVLTAGERKWRISSDEVPIEQNTEEILAKAYALGRSGSLEARYDAIQALAREGRQFETEMTYDRQAVRSLTDIVATRLYVDGFDAAVTGFDPQSKTFSFSPEQAGQCVDGDALYAQTIACLDEGRYGATLEVSIQPIVPRVTMAQLQASYGLLSTYSTQTTKDKNRNTNIALSAEALNGRVMEPGAILSYNECTGERTAAKGYREAGAIKNGQTVDDIGGGVCQTSTTLFNALIRAGLDIVERRPHAWPASYVPRGEDAMVDWPKKDLKMQNNSAGNIYIFAYYADQQVTVEVYGMSLGAGVTYELYSDTTRTYQPTEPVYTQNPSLAVGTENILRKARTGYVVQTYLVTLENGVETGREKAYTSEYKVYNKEVEYN